MDVHSPILMESVNRIRVSDSVRKRLTSADTSGVGEGSWEAGMWDYKVLPLPGSEEVNDHRLGASYSYDRQV